MLGFLFISLLCVAKVLSYADESVLEYGNTEAEYETRALCPLVLECTGIGDIEWSISGGSVLENDEHRFVNVSTYTTLQSNMVYVSSLIFSPVIPTMDNPTPYTCSVNGKAVLFSVTVDPDVIEISPIPDVNISNYKVGESVMVDILVETCLEDVTVSVYEERNRVFSTRVTNNHQTSINVQFPLKASNSAVNGDHVYSVRAVANEASTPITTFTVIGSPRQE